MVLVDPLFVGEFATEVWTSKKLQDFVKKYSRKHHEEIMRLLGKIEDYARAGFENFEGSQLAIRHEFDGVYRIGRDASLFRMIGFYENDRRCCFLLMDGFLKRGQKLSESDRKRIASVAQIKKLRHWSKRTEAGPT